MRLASPFAGMTDARADSTERAARLAAEAACRRKDEFLAEFAHELRSPLASAVIAAGLIDRLPGDDPRAATARDVLRRQLEQARRLVDDMLDIERVMSGTIELAFETVDLAAVVRERVSAMANPAETANLDAQPAAVLGDPVRLQQIVDALLAYATTHTPPGGRIAVTVAVEDDAAVLRVVDGARDASAAAPKPKGLALSVMRRLVELHGGRVHAVGTGPDHGSGFVVRLPVASNASTTTR